MLSQVLGRETRSLPPISHGHSCKEVLRVSLWHSHCLATSKRISHRAMDEGITCGFMQVKTYLEARLSFYLESEIRSLAPVIHKEIFQVL